MRRRPAAEPRETPAGWRRPCLRPGARPPAESRMAAPFPAFRPLARAAGGAGRAGAGRRRPLGRRLVRRGEAARARIGWRYVGLAHGVYALFETDAGLVLLDRRAAHERVWYERLREQFATAQVATQRLLLPVPVELDADHDGAAARPAGVSQRPRF